MRDKHLQNYSHCFAFYGKNFNSPTTNSRCVPHCFSVFGPEGLRLVRVTDVSLLVEWQSVRGAEYYILKYHPKGNERALQQVVLLFSLSGLSAGIPNRKKIKTCVSYCAQVQIPNTRNSYLITGLSPGVTYMVQVYAVIKGAQSEADRIEATTGELSVDQEKN